MINDQEQTRTKISTKPVIIIPTFNEEKSIYKVLKGIKQNLEEAAIILVDARSDDDTILITEAFQKKYNDIIIISQESRNGFGEALVLGFKKALENNFDPIITMDGDGSHDPVYLPKFISLCRDYELILASRYKNGVRVEGERFRKLIVSKLANVYISYVMVKPVWDFTSGFRCYSKKFISSLNLNTLRKESYIIQIELLSLLFSNKMRFKEIPFIYKDSMGRKTKLSFNHRIKTFFFCLKYRAPIVEIMRHFLYLNRDYDEFVKEYDDFINPPKLQDKERQKTEKFNISVGVFAHNEETIIAQCIHSLLNQNLSNGIINEIIVVSSGSTDNTNTIIHSISEQDNRVKPVIQMDRHGKANAINEFLSRATGDIVILESADTIPEPGTIQAMSLPFSDKSVGVVGAHPIPINSNSSIADFSVKKLWELHHLMSLDNPKCGEMIAFRNIIPFIPEFTAVDEATIEALFVKEGYKLAYAPDAIVRNKGPETIREFVRQRRRIASGHRHLAAAMGHNVSTKYVHTILKYIFKTQKWNPKDITYMLMLIFVEGYSRFLGMVDYYFRDKNPYIWMISKSTKSM